MHRATRVPYGGSGASRREKALETIRVIAVNVLFTAFVVVCGYYLFVTYQVKQAETQQKRLEVEEARRDLEHTLAVNLKLKRQADFLRTEEGVEKVAREKLGLIRPHEVSFVVVNGSGARATETPSPSRPRPADAPGKAASSSWFSFLGVFHIFWNGE